MAALYSELEDRLNRLPSVQGSGLALYNPLTDNWGELVYVAGHAPHKFDEESGASWDRVSANYLQNLGVTVRRGRAFTTADNETSELVAVVNEAFVKRFFKSDEDPVDQHFGLDFPENAGTFRIVGVVQDAKFAGCGLSRPARPMFYVPLAQTVDYKQDLMVEDRAALALYRGNHAGHQHLPRHDRTTAEEDISGSGSQPDDHQRPDDAAASRDQLRSGTGGSQSRGPVRDGSAPAGGGGFVRRHGLLGSTAHQ